MCTLFGTVSSETPQNLGHEFCFGRLLELPIYGEIVTISIHNRNSGKFLSANSGHKWNQNFLIFGTVVTLADRTETAEGVHDKHFDRFHFLVLKNLRLSHFIGNTF